MLNKKKDGHVHTPFCPHGTKDTFEAYVEEAMVIGREEISFTEHFPMPEEVTTPEFYRECVLMESEIPDYIKSVKQVKKQYEDRIRINVGFEIDYIEGKEKEITDRLNEYGTEIEDSILSVHFVKFNEKYYAIDYLPEFEMLLKKVGNIEKVYDIYFETLLKSIQSDLGPFKPKRIGHPTLIRIFNKKYPCTYKNDNLLNEIATTVKQKGYEIDYNVAGLRKIYCKEVYPTGKLLTLLEHNNISMVYGTDSHQSGDISS